MKYFFLSLILFSLLPFAASAQDKKGEMIVDQTERDFCEHQLVTIENGRVVADVRGHLMYFEDYIKNCVGPPSGSALHDFLVIDCKKLADAAVARGVLCDRKRGVCGALYYNQIDKSARNIGRQSYKKLCDNRCSETCKTLLRPESKRAPIEPKGDEKYRHPTSEEDEYAGNKIDRGTIGGLSGINEAFDDGNTFKEVGNGASEVLRMFDATRYTPANNSGLTTNLGKLKDISELSYQTPSFYAAPASPQIFSPKQAVGFNTASYEAPANPWYRSIWNWIVTHI